MLTSDHIQSNMLESLDAYWKVLKRVSIGKGKIILTNVYITDYWVGQKFRSVIM